MGQGEDDDVVDLPKLVRPATPGRMKLGFNYAWAYELYGAQIGPNPWVPWQQWLDEQKLAQAGQEKKLPLPSLFKNVDRNLDHLKKMGIEVVRWFLLCNGFNYGLGGANRTLQPSPPESFHTCEFEFNPPFKADPRFVYHFEELLKRFKTSGMQMIPSFIDFGWIADFNGGAADRKGSRTPGRRGESITDRNKRLILLTLLNDMLKVSRSYAAQIYAWEVCNEPNWMQRLMIPHANPAGLMVHRVLDDRGNHKSFDGGAIPRSVLADFLAEAIQSIEAGGFKGKSTVGHRYYQDIVGPDAFPTGSLPQFHYYADVHNAKLSKRFFGLDPETMPAFTGANPPFLGEFASDASGPEQNGPWAKDLPNSDTTLNRLKLLERLGCKLALIWPDKSGSRGLLNPDGTPKLNPKGEQETVQEDWVKLEEKTRTQVVQFTGGTFVPLESPDP